MEAVDNVVLKEEPVDDNTLDSYSLDMANAVKIERGDVGKDVGSLDPASTVYSELEAITEVNREMDIGLIALPDVSLTPRRCKPEPVEDSPEHSLKKEPIHEHFHDRSSLDAVNTVKLEPIAVGEDVGSLDLASTVETELETTPDVKQEIDIEAIVLQPPDVHFTPRPLKSEPVEDFAAQNMVAITRWSNTTTEESASSSTSLHVGTHAVDQDNLPYTCGICKKLFRLKNKLQIHVLITHTEKTQNPCFICFKYFTQQSSLKQHMLIHTGERPHCCSVCKKFFTRKTDLKTHMTSHTGERPYCCSVCNKSFARKVDLKNHMIIHTGKGPHCCSVCDKSFAQKCQLKSHTMSHTGERPHCCRVCNKSFSQKYHLKSHMMNHTGERPYCCSVCHKSFTRKEILQTHIISHTGNRPHCCSVCNKSFAQKCHLKTHIMSHTGERPHCCDVCKKSYTRKSDLNKHILFHK